MNAKQSRKRGRPSREEPRRVVYFKESTFLIWNARKQELSRDRGGGTLTSDEFADYLLKILVGRDDQHSNVRQMFTSDHMYFAEPKNPAQGMCA